jgi:NAD(P)-dependent dehydrogenase (short-subunit alcohol dehydrogenase family)
LAIATALAQEDASVIVNGRSKSLVEGAIEELKASTGSDVQAFSGDPSIAASAEELARLFPNVGLSVFCGAVEPTDGRDKR